MSALVKDEKILIKLRKEDTPTGVTRTTVKRLAAQLGFNETQAVNYALARLAKEVLPTYEQDDGPLSQEVMDAIREQVPQDKVFTPTRTLF